MTCFNYTTWVRIDTVRLYHFYVLFIYLFIFITYGLYLPYRTKPQPLNPAFLRIRSSNSARNASKSCHY